MVFAVWVAYRALNLKASPAMVSQKNMLFWSFIHLGLLYLRFLLVIILGAMLESILEILFGTLGLFGATFK